MSTQKPGEGGVATDTKTKTKTKTKLARPKLYKVILHNDDYTTMEFVVAILQGIFHRSEAEATAIMLHIHRHGAGVGGIYPYAIAEAKVSEVMQVAEKADYPLLCTMEPDDDPGSDPDGGEGGPGRGGDHEGEGH